MKKFTNYLIVIATVIYVLSPIDLFPGLVLDDLVFVIVTLGNLVKEKNTTNNE